ncbi:MAG: AIR synthase-related protein [Lachnospiraceae bacterium]|nr:AIR synthase-related protein [Lachnospiraceae bacterium]
MIMNYREKQKKTQEEKKIRKLSQYRKRYADPQIDPLDVYLTWEKRADEQIDLYRESSPLLPEAGEELYMTGYAGAAGTVFLAEWRKTQLLSRFTEAFIRTAFDKEVFDHLFEENRENPEELPAYYMDAGADWIAPVGEGGLLRTLYRFGKETGLGFRVQSRAVPIRQITIEFCELLLLHPWELLTSKSFLFAAKPSAPILERLRKEGVPVSRIGIVTGDKQKLICRGEEESGINRPEPDGLLTLLLEEKRP